MRATSSGFSLIELIIVVVILGILSAVVMIGFDAKKQHAVVVQADEFRRNLSHLQLLAISQGIRLKLTVASDGYSVYCATATTSPCPALTSTPITDPATGEPFRVGYPLDDGATFTAGIGSYYFDSLGRPVTASTGATLNPNSLPFKLNTAALDNEMTITVQAITGFAK